MRSKLVPIGNSKGVRIPKAILEAVGLTDAIDLRVEDGRLVITPVRRSRAPREGWERAIRADIKRNGPLESVDADRPRGPKTSRPKTSGTKASGTKTSGAKGRRS